MLAYGKRNGHGGGTVAVSTRITRLHADVEYCLL